MITDQAPIQIKVHDDELVVDLEHVDQVQAKLESFRVPCETVDRSSTLGLALLRLDLSECRATDMPALDQVLFDLRESFKEEFRWTPTIGKNRLVGVVAGSPYTGGGQGAPTPYTGGGTGVPTPYTGGGRGVPSFMAFSGRIPAREYSLAPHVRVGIVDTRLFEHQDLAGRYLASRDALLAKETDAPSLEAHATFIAGLVLQRAPNVDLIVDHVLNEYDISSSSWDVATRMAGFVDSGVPVLNISFGAITADDEPPLVLRRAVEVLSRTVTVVAAAGNHGRDGRKMWPAALEEVVAVGAAQVDAAGRFEGAEFSPDAPWVDLLAPGEDVVSTYETHGFAAWNGTSFSAAAVSGAIAYLIETRKISGADAVRVLQTPPAAREPGAGDKIIDDIGPKL